MRHTPSGKPRRTTNAKGSTQVSVPIRRQDGTPIPAPLPVTGTVVAATGYWSPLTVTIGGVTELVYVDGDTVAVWSPT